MYRLILPTQRMVAQPIDVYILGSTVIQGIPSESGEYSTSRLDFTFSFQENSYENIDSSVRNVRASINK